MMATTESLSPPRGLSPNPLTSGPASGTSSSASDEQSTGAGGLRASIGKVRERRRKKSIGSRRTSEDSPRPDSSSRLSSLIPGRRRSRRPQDADGLERNLGVDTASPNLTTDGNRSESSLLLAGSGASSLLTDDNTDGEGKPGRPTLESRPSHTGYLTSSSPEISVAQHGSIDSATRVTTASNAAFAASSTSIPQIVEPTNNEPFPPLDHYNSSPIDRLKGAFSRKQSDSDSDLIRSTGVGSEVGSANTKPSTSSITGDTAQAKAGAEFHSGTTQSDKSQVQSDKSAERPGTPTRQAGRPRVDTSSIPATPPNLTETPTTLVTPPTPTDSDADASTFARRTAFAAKRTSPAKSIDSIKHRRSQSGNIPSKLSQSIAPPLTPTVEETKTPGGTLTAGFFTSFFGAAQKAADQLSTSIGTSTQKNKSVNTPSAETQGAEEVIPGSGSQRDLQDTNGEKKLAAVETLGTGDLNFSHLGISEGLAPSPMNSTTDLTSQPSFSPGNDANGRAEEEAATNRAISAAYEKPHPAVASQISLHRRPLSVSSNDRLTLEDHTPPRPDELKRSGSVRSKLSGRRRRHRASSATAGTGNSIAAALTASATGLANPSVNGAGHRLTGFAVASSKRNKDFHQLFRSVPEDDYLIEDYSAALQRDILLHGRLYVSEGHICFSSNILGWVTNLVVSFDEVVSVEKKSTAVIFPNAIVIQTLHSRNTFASFVARDSTYELLIGIWKISHPNLKSSLNGVTLDDAGTGDKTEVADPDGSDAGDSDSGSEDEVYDEDADDDVGSFTDAGLVPSIAGSDIGDVRPALSRKTSAIPLANGTTQSNGAVPKGLEGADAAVTGAAVSADFPGPPTHEATHCSDEHYDRPIMDVVIPAPLGKIYSMMFGPASGAFMRKWHVEEQKSRELNFPPDDKIGLDNDHKTLTIEYIKPLSGAAGPKQTKCITTFNLLAFDLDKAVTVDCGTVNPDVPSGNVFTTKTRYCLMWAPGNSTRMISTCAIEWTGKSWIKGIIEKSANDGQVEYVKSLVAALNQAVTVKPPVKGVAVTKKGKRKGKKEVFDAEVAVAQRETSVAAEKQASNWGLLEPLHKPLSPIISLLSPFITSQVLIAVLVALLAYSWISPRSSRGSSQLAFPGYTSPQRLAAYEEIWRREESSLWEWLEDRVGLDGVYAPRSTLDVKQKVLAEKNMAKKLDGEHLREVQMDDAIRVTEERLATLKDAVARKKSEAKRRRSDGA